MSHDSRSNPFTGLETNVVAILHIALNHLRARRVTWVRRPNDSIMVLVRVGIGNNTIIVCEPV
jgi:hypothetical protein